MLDLSALSQLKELKKQIQASVIRSQGIVKGTSKRFGFVVDEKDGQQYLLPQAAMDLLLPGDTIQFVLEKSKSDEEKPIARVEKLISTQLSYFIGQVKAKNNQLFVAPDHPHFNRWVFIPPKFRKNLVEGDLVAATIIQHPFKNEGRTQASIDVVLGKPDDPFIEHRYAIAKEGIVEKIWQADDIEAIRQTSERTFEHALENKTDCRDMLFVTIDGVSTQDLDDALSIKKIDNGWQLSIAIADASTFITPGSPLDKIAARQGASIYLPGQKVPMLPEVLSADLCSLRQDKDRLALICQLDISVNGDISNTRYIDAVINSRARLNYDDVAAFLEGGNSNYSDDVKNALQELHQLAKTRTQWRIENAQPPEDYPDYRLWLNERGKITQIEHLERNCAQTLVEECMLACNEATASYLKAHYPEALYLTHDGFKQDQLPGIEKLLEGYFPEFTIKDVVDLAGYRRLMKAADNNTTLPFREILRKKLNRSVWSAEGKPHFGLGVEAYTTFTSPIRKYSDLLVHRLIKAQLGKAKAPKLSTADIEQLNNAMQAIRNAQRDCELSLKCQYIEGFRDQTFTGTISMINHRVIGVYLAQFDLHGQIDVSSLEIPFTFKQDTLQLLSEHKNFQLMQEVQVTLDQVDLRQRSVKLRLVEPQ